MRQYDIYVVNLDPTVGSEIRKTRPCLIISPDEMNKPLNTVQVAPLTTSLRTYPWRVPVRFQRKDGMVALDQIRTVDKARLVRRIGKASPKTIIEVKAVIHEMLVE
jgi:mRNA interferase MazF